jgi:hypothetical protein
MTGGALDPAGVVLTLDEVRARIKREKSIEVPPINDEDQDSNILNNQAVLAYQRNNFQGCVELFIKL